MNEYIICPRCKNKLELFYDLDSNDYSVVTAHCDNDSYNLYLWYDEAAEYIYNEENYLIRHQKIKNNFFTEIIIIDYKTLVKLKGIFFDFSDQNVFDKLKKYLTLI